MRRRGVEIRRSVVAELRRQRGWTQEQLAAEAGVSGSLVAMIEAGRRQASYRTAIDLAAALGVELDDLTGADDEGAA